MQFQANGFCSIRGCISLPVHFGCLLNQLCNRRHLKSQLYCLLGTNGEKNKTSGTKIKLNCTLCKITDSCTSHVGFSTERTASVNTAVSTSASLRLLTLNGRAIGFRPRATKCSCAYKTLLFSSLSQDDIWDVPTCPLLGTSHSCTQRINLSMSGAIKATRLTYVPEKR